MLACTLLIQSTDVEKSAYYCKMAADNGELTAMHHYGKINEEGYGVPINLKESIKYYKMAVDKGYVPAMVDYARLIIKGVGSEFPPNRREFWHYIKIAAENGDKSALYAYGSALIIGKEFPADIEKGLKY